MASREHVAILKQGVKVWNSWRQDNPHIRPDLNYINLSPNGNSFMKALEGVNFMSAKLMNANLQGINLIGADLRYANLTGAALSTTDLTNANLRDAHLMSTNLVGANLSNANLSKSWIVGTYFRGTNLNGANFSDAKMLLAIFSNVDLSTAIDLDTVDHQGPSTIGTDAIYKSNGDIPEVFLKGAGVIEDFIIYCRSLTFKSIDYHTCFISYSSKDEEFAKRLYTDLQAKGVRCWFAPHDMRIGDKIRPRIDESILLYDKLLLVLSDNSVASHWVEHEVETAIGKELAGKPNVLLPIRLDESVMQSKTGWASHVRLTRHIGDFTHWKDHDNYQQSFKRLLRDLKAEA